MNYEILEPYKNMLISKKLKAYNEVIGECKRNARPEMKLHTGYTQEQNIERLEKERGELLSELHRNTPLKYLNFSKSEILNYLRHEAYSLRRQAIDFSSNNLIVMRNLRQAVKIAHTMIKIEPRLDIYSLHWIINNTPITIKD